MTPEGRVKAKVNRRLAAIPYLWKFMPVQMGMGAPALDYLICANGFFIVIETKVKGKTLTPRQVQTKALMEAAGALVFVVDDNTSLDIAIEKITLLCSIKGRLYHAYPVETHKRQEPLDVDAN